uniref:IBH1-like N-terminal domain-containing protein n=3 Tax=Noccaea caerulescens TaxID=107243 RepID=A0A1J3EVX1_NOCCA
MERQTMNKRQRVFSLQPNKNPNAVFARRYASHVVPALKKININKPSSQVNHKSFEQTVKHEVDMAFALSAQEFAWSRFLQHKLLSSVHEDSSESSKILERSNYKQDGEEEGGEIKNRLKELQKLLPGGEEMNMDEMLSEIGSYIVCLELQMIVLKSLVQDN